MPFSDEARHLFLERVAVIFDFLGTDIATGRKDMAVGGDFGGGGGFAKSRHIGIAGISLTPSLSQWERVPEAG